MEQTFHVRFDDFEFDSDLGVFHESGTKINLRPKELTVLEVLLRGYGKLVTKEQLINSAWKGANTSDESIARCICLIKSRLREANPNADALIKTEYGRGYRFVGSVSLIGNAYQKEVGKIKKISDIYSKNILNCSPDATILEVSKLLHQQRKSSIIINQNQNYIGIWTEADAMALDLTDASVFDTKISEVMHSPVITIQEWKPVSDAVTQMRSCGIRHLLVVDKYAKACGVITQTDLVRCHGVESFLTVKDIRSVVYRSPLTITEDVSVSEIVVHMRQKTTEIAIISLSEQEMFAFTERDLMKLIANKSLHILVSELGNPPLITVSEEMTLLAARQLMEIKQIRHLGVLDDQGNLQKILGLADILRVIEYSYVHLLEEVLEENKQLALNKDGHFLMLSNAVQQTAGMIFITNKFGELEFVNKAFENITGYTLDEVKGLNTRFLKSGTMSKTIYQNLWQTLLSGKTWKGELCNQTKSGQKYWVLVSIAPIYDANNELINFVAVGEDITERVQMENKLRDVEQRFDEMANSSFIMLWESGVDGNFTYINQSWVEFTGCEVDDLLGNGWAKRIHTDDLNVFLDVFQRALIQRNEFTFDHRLKNSAGEYRWVINAAQPRINQNGNFLGFRGYCIDITERKIRELSAQKLAYYDNLTGLATKFLFDDRLEQFLLQSKRANTPLALMNIDLDGFSQVNELYGKFTGDLLLQQVAARICNCFRKSDTICRYGEDEFVILAIGLQSKENINFLVQKVLQAFEEQFEIWDHKINMSCNIGAAVFPADAESKESLLSAVDNAMYQAKQQGKASVVYN